MKRHFNRYRMVGILGLFIAILLIVGSQWASINGYRLNQTVSMPQGLWQVHPLLKPLQRSQAVCFCPPDTAVFRMAKKRGYIDSGNCPGGYLPLLKTVIALPGDRVEIERKGVSVNGHWIPNSAIWLQDNRHRPLPQLKPGVYPVKENEVWLLSTYYPRSFDSRYFGPVAITAIQGVATPVWVNSP